MNYNAMYFHICSATNAVNKASTFMNDMKLIEIKLKKENIDLDAKTSIVLKEMIK